MQAIYSRTMDHLLAGAAIDEPPPDLKAVLDQLPDAISVLGSIRDPEGGIVDFRWLYANEAAHRLTNHPPGELVGRRLLEVLPALFEICRTVVETGQSHVAPDHRCEEPGRGRRLIDLRATKLHDGLMVVSRDVTELREQSARLERVTHESRLLNDLADLLCGCLSSDEAHSVVAMSCEALFPSYTGSLSVLQSGRYETVMVWGEESVGAPVFGASDCWALRLGRPHVSDLREPRCRHLDAAPGLGCLCVPLSGRGQKAGILHLFRAGGAEAFDDPVVRLAQTTCRQISMAFSNLQLRDALRGLSVRDSLTGLFNRRYLEETLTRDLARVSWSGTSIGVIVLDLDHFEDYNRRHGQEAGDLVLKTVGSLLIQASRVSDVACRSGGQFTLLLPDAPLEVTGARAEELRQRIEKLRIQYRQTDLPGVTVSCGVASGPEHGSDAETLLRAADGALQEVKRAGRNGVIRASVP